MAGFIPDEIVERIRDECDILDLAGRYVHLKKKGRYYFGLCPFHSERTPSFSVDPEKQIFHCFGCGAGGDIYTLKMNLENLTFAEAVREIANEVGIAIPDQNEAEGDVSHARRKKKQNTRSP